MRRLSLCASLCLSLCALCGEETDALYAATDPGDFQLLAYTAAVAGVEESCLGASPLRLVCVSLCMRLRARACVFLRVGVGASVAVAVSLVFCLSASLLNACFFLYRFLREQRGDPAQHRLRLHRCL